jgi:hypothetical protein
MQTRPAPRAALGVPVGHVCAIVKTGTGLIKPTYMRGANSQNGALDAVGEKPPELPCEFASVGNW